MRDRLVYRVALSCGRRASLSDVGRARRKATLRTGAWRNSGTRAAINHSTSTQAGSTLLVIKDAAGTTVYSKALSPSLNEPTIAGVAGAWSVQLTLTSYRGTLNFRAQKL